MGGAVSAKSERRGASILTVVGKAQLSGEGLPNSRSDAARLFALAADEGDAHGICALADCHMNGWGVPYDPPGAFQMYKEAAALGYPPAMHCLGLCHRAGVGNKAFKNKDLRSKNVRCNFPFLVIVVHVLIDFRIDVRRDYLIDV